MNWVDLLIFLFFVVMILGGLNEGFIQQLIGLITAFLGIIMAVPLYPPVAQILIAIGIVRNWAVFVGFGIVFVIVQVVLGALLHVPRNSIRRWLKNSTLKPVDRILGPVPAVASGVLVISFVMGLLVIYPISEDIKTGIERSRLGAPISAPAIAVLKANAPQDFLR